MNILISACLLGQKCRYDGKDKNRIDLSVFECHNLIPVCPEVDGGLPVPRAAAERVGSLIINNEGKDVTAEYTKGAELALHTALENNCKIAILKAKSPSCGKGKIYDGTFSRTLADGNGVTAELLQANGIAVYTEDEINLIQL
ncbi:MAG: DUF523 domain-containing protein [Clostridia bacterium]|nr:DUF523 domain-containing protein [Clostridia bacterium]